MAKLFVISGPSGSGKTTIVKKLLEELPDLSFSISYTTRKPRDGEVNGRDYFFVSREEFISLVEKGEMLEWAEVHGELYGTSKVFVEKKLKKGLDVLLDIDTQGAKRLMKSGVDHISIFVLPPSIEELRRRIEKRGTEDEESLKIRMERAEKEILDSKFYRHIIINDDLGRALSEVKAIITAYRTSGRRF